MPRGWVWLQLAVAWLPLWALFTALIMLAHGLPAADAAFSALRMIVPGAILGVAVYRFTARMPWPHPFRVSFVGVHVLAASLYATSWLILISIADSFMRGQIVLAAGPGIGLFLITGIWLYVVVAGVAYANHAAQRNAQIQAHAARMQLAALRTQLHPHFLFNALHTVVQLIPMDPRGATRAAEQLAGALRIAIEEQRDLITLAEEWAFVERYLAIECIRFGDRLSIRTEIDAAATSAILPSFALQTLVENAVRHGAAPRVEPTQLTVLATVSGKTLTLTVADTGGGASAEQIERGPGTGLRRLRERMQWLYGNRAQLDLVSAVDGGFVATLVVPQSVTDALGKRHVGNDDDE
jgi:signal transduction histidine kinase